MRRLLAWELAEKDRPTRHTPNLIPFDDKIKCASLTTYLTRPSDSSGVL